MRPGLEKRNILAKPHPKIACQLQRLVGRTATVALTDLAQARFYVSLRIVAPGRAF